MNKQKLLSAYFLLILAALFWSGNFVVGRVVHSDIPPFTFAFCRWMLVILLLLPFNYSTMTKNIPMIRKNIVGLLVLSMLGIAINSSFVYLGLNFTTVLNTSLIYATVPVLIMLMSFILLGESLSQKKLFGMLLSFFGAIFILSSGDLLTISAIHYQLGDFFILIAVISWALFSVIYKKMSIEISPFVFLLVTAIIGNVFLLPCMLLEQYMGHIAHYNLLSLSGVLYASLFASVLAITYWNIGVRVAGPSVAAHFFNLLPMFGSILSILILGETMHWYHFVGGFFILLGVLLAALEGRKVNYQVANLDMLINNNSKA